MRISGRWFVLFSIILGLLLIGGGLFLIIFFNFYLSRVIISESLECKRVPKKYLEHLKKFRYIIGNAYIFVGVLSLLNILTLNITVIIAIIISVIITPIGIIKIVRKYYN